jgi:V/A-type H+-transporting ATPase subunit K
MELFLIAATALCLSMVGLGVACILKIVKKDRIRKFFGINVSTLFCVMIAATAFILLGGVPVSAAAAETATAAAASSDGLRFIAAALSTGLAGIGAGIAVSATGSAALGALSEDPKILGKALVFVGLAEGIAIYGLIISIMILNA